MTLTEKRAEVVEILFEYGNLLIISDWGLVAQGSMIDEIIYDEDNDVIHFYAGNMTEDKYAEEVFPNDQELNMFFDEILDNF